MEAFRDLYHIHDKLIQIVVFSSLWRAVKHFQSTVFYITSTESLLTQKCHGPYTILYIYCSYAEVHMSNGIA